MDELRVAVTTIPVGPRGTPILDSQENLLFALQATAGFATDPESGTLNDLWPWSILELDGGSVPVKAWRIESDGSTSPIAVTSVAMSDGGAGFADQLRQQIKLNYRDLEAELDLRLYFPGELSPDEAEEVLPRNFPTRTSYLSSLAGEVSRRLLATVYVSIPRDELFERVGDTWRTKDDARALYLAPAELQRSDSHEAQGDPAPVDELFKLPYGTEGDTAAWGPGYAITSFVEPASSAVFDLSTFWLDVETGDSRMTDLEGFLLEILDPFSETSQLPGNRLAGELQSPPGRALSADEIAAARQLWRIQVFEELLTEPHPLLNRALRILAKQLDGQADVARLLDLVPDHWRPALRSSGDGSLLHTVLVVGQRLGLAEPDQASAVRALAERCSFSTLAEWLAGCFAETLEHEDLEALRRLWELSESSDRSTAAERQLALAHIALERSLQETLVKDFLNRVLATVTSADSSIEAMRSDLAALTLPSRWTVRLQARVADALKTLGHSSVGEELVLDTAVRTALAQEYLDEAWPHQENRPSEIENAGRPMNLVFGNPDHRLVHEASPEVAQSNVFDEVTGHILLVRRHTMEEKIGEEPWSLVSGGVAVIDEPEGLFEPEESTDDWLGELLPVAEENIFVNGVVRADRGYDGQLRHIQSPLRFAYAASGGDASGSDGEETSAPSYTYQGLGGYSGADEDILSAAAIAKAPPLRYGDRYQFAAGLVDAAGGLPLALARRGEPWRVNLEAFGADADIVHSDSIPYFRRQPVGQLNLLPFDRDQGWPMLTRGVALRCREWHSGLASTDDGEARPLDDDVPAILLHHDESIATDTKINEYRATIEPPSIDEFTLRRWAVPRRDASDEEKIETLDALTNALENIHVHRNQQADEDSSSFDARSMVHDPSVTAIGVHVQIFAIDGTIALEHRLVKELQDAELPFRKQAIEVVVRTGDSVTTAAELAAQSPDQLVIVLEPGTFAAIDCSPLIDDNLFDDGSNGQRFAEVELFGALIEADNLYEGFVGFQATRILAEVSTGRLPSAGGLYNALSLERRGGQVMVDFGELVEADRIALQFVDRYSVQRKRWAWRNRPTLVSFKGLENVGDEGERRRLAASGLPRQAFDAATRDDSQEVRDWEGFADYDLGFPDRGSHENRWPRSRPDSDAAGGGAGNFTLLADSRDGASRAEYYHYGLEVTSRYAPLLEHPRQVAVGPHDEYRRIVVPYEGTEIKPPKILSVVPLTRSVAADPLAKTGATPFLVLLDETWFREYGAGERLDIRLALEELDLGEKECSSRPYRTGALPDHWLPVGGGTPYFRGVTVSQDEDNEDPQRLDAFGPFGFTLDESPDEALANTTGFVVYPPEDVGPHWVASVQFRRLLDQPGSACRFSEPSSVHALYTLPDEDVLVRSTDTEVAGIRLIQSADNTELKDFEASLLGDWNLSPLFVPAGADQAFTTLRASEALAEKNYRYFLLVSRIARSTGQGDDVELPQQLLRLVKNDQGMTAQGLRSAPPLDPAEPHRARVLEVVVNGKYEDGVSRLDRDLTDNSELSNREFWTEVLGPGKREVAEMQDAAGMIRRVSRSFAVRLD